MLRLRAPGERGELRSCSRCNTREKWGVVSMRFGSCGEGVTSMAASRVDRTSPGWWNKGAIPE